MVLDAEKLATNLQSLLNISSKAIEVLKNAKKKDNHEISKIVGIDHTTVSTIMNRAKVFEFVEKKDGKWLKTKQIKGIELYKSARINFRDFIKKSDAKTPKASKIRNPLQPLSYYNKANEMMEPYRDLFCLEASLRDFIRKIFQDEKDWLDKRLDEDIKKSITKAKEEPYYAHKVRKDDLEYTTLGQLLVIITSNKNWKDIMPYLNETNKNDFTTTFKKILPSRNATAHCVCLNKDDRSLINSRVREIAFMFKF